MRRWRYIRAPTRSRRGWGGPQLQDYRKTVGCLYRVYTFPWNARDGVPSLLPSVTGFGESSHAGAFCGRQPASHRVRRPGLNARSQIVGSVDAPRMATESVRWNRARRIFRALREGSKKSSRCDRRVPSRRRSSPRPDDLHVPRPPGRRAGRHPDNRSMCIT
jgi:hypothetical protein